MTSKRLIIFFLITSFAVVMFSSCSTSKTIYYWGPESENITKYEKVTYDYYKYQSPQSVCNLISTYQDIILNCKANEKMIPPGVCAEFGYILLNPVNEEYFNEYASKSQKRLMAGIVFMEYGKEMIEKEVTLYPEARKFLEPIIKRITNEYEED